MTSHSLPNKVYELVHQIEPFTTSIILGGSWATGEQVPESDIDICIICSDRKGKSEVERRIHGHSIGGKKRKQLDVRIFTVNEFGESINSKQNAYWYSFFQSAVHLRGTPVDVPLLRHLLRDTIWEVIEELTEHLNFIEQSIFLEVVCYNL